jgi:GT2 family glycosyltransferase
VTVYAPIALFVYNRPDHARQTVEALQKNELASVSDLFIFSDGPRDDVARSGVSAVRNYMNAINGFKKVTIVERDKNLGLAASIISGVTEIVNGFGKVIVLEDDLVTSPFFLRYMNDALDFYRDETKVMHVSGGAYPIGDMGTDDTYFLRIPLCWGWGTWKRAWDKFEKKLEIMQQFDRRMISRFNFDDTYPYWRQLELNRDGLLNTWFVFWYARVYLSGALALFPKKALVSNIGHDGTGAHCGATDLFNVELSPEPIRIEHIPIAESRKAVGLHKKYFRSIHPKWLLRNMRVFSRMISALKGWSNCQKKQMGGE